MEVNANSLSLFNYIGDNNQSNSVLEGIAQNHNQDVRGGLDTLEIGLNNGQLEETFQLLENGEIDIVGAMYDVKTGSVYFTNKGAVS